MAIYKDGAPAPVLDFLRYIELNLGHSSKTAEEYYLDLRTFFRFMKQERGIAGTDTPFDEIDISDIDKDFIEGIRKTDIYNFIDYLRGYRTGHMDGHETVGLATTTTKRKLATLKSFFSYLATGVEIISSDPCAGIVMPKIPQAVVPKYFTEKEAMKLLNSVSGINEARDYCIVLIFLTCGVRVSEIVGINLQDLKLDDSDQQFLTIRGKGNKERQVFLSDACVDAINDYLRIREDTYQPDWQSKSALFLSRKHNRMSVDAVQMMVKKATKRAGLQELSPHKLRHTAATIMVQNGVDIRTIMDVLGHEDLSTTQIYTHCSDGQLRVAVRANPLSKGRTKKIAPPKT